MTRPIIIQPDADSHGARKENIFIAQDSLGNTLGVLLLYPFYDELTEAEHPHNVSLLLHIPEGQELSESARDQLFERALERATTIKGESGQPKTRLYVSFLKGQLDQSEYFLERGFQQDESMQILEWVSGAPQPDVSLPSGIKVQNWEMAREEDRQRFITVHRTVFPRHPYSTQRLGELTSLPGWSNLTAFQEDQICGNIMFLSDPDHPGAGLIEDLIVVSGWRQQGIGSFLLASALDQMQAAGMQRVRLEMWSANRNAWRLYQKFGFQVVDETEFAFSLYV